MGFTNVAWESRGAKQLALDLTTGPGPTSIGQAGAAWERVANEWANITDDYNKIVDKIRGSFSSRGADAAARKLEEFGQWLQSASLAAAENGERAERAAVAYGVAVLEMPSVSEVVQAKTTQDVMASLAAYDCAVLDGKFAELDDTVAAHHADATTAMYTYEETCNSLAVPWEQPNAPDGKNVAAQRYAAAGDPAAGGGVGVPSVAGGGFLAPAPLGSFRVDEVKSTRNATTLRGANSSSTASTAAIGPAGAGYGPMAALGRGSGREYQSAGSQAVPAGGGDPAAGLSQHDSPWLPYAERSEAPFTVAHVSWAQDAPTLDAPVAPSEPPPPQFAGAVPPTLEQVSDRWVAPPIIGADKELTL